MEIKRLEGQVRAGRPVSQSDLSMTVSAVDFKKRGAAADRFGRRLGRRGEYGPALLRNAPLRRVQTGRLLRLERWLLSHVARTPAGAPREKEERKNKNQPFPAHRTSTSTAPSSWKSVWIVPFFGSSRSIHTETPINPSSIRLS